MRNNHCAEIESVQKGTIAEKSGIKAGDRLVSINNHKIRDLIDLMFYGSEQRHDILIQRQDRMLNIEIKKPLHSASELGIQLRPFKIRTCKNNCIFCFVSQLPKGLRRTLYIKDEDYRMSFLYGSYITMTNLSEADKKRIIEQRLSPLYISVHCTNTAIRNKMLGNQKAPDILKEIMFLSDNRIRMHAQIVLCPDYNDGKHLEKTIRDLYRFYPYMLSIAVVPVGLTRYRKKPIKPVGKNEAIKAIEIVRKYQARFRKKHGDNIVYAADELYIKAEQEMPLLKDYGDLPQIENGVGGVALFRHESKKIKILDSNIDKENRKKFITFTGVSFYPFLLKYIERLRKGGIDIDVIPIENDFFGKSVTVAGLLTGRDVMKNLSGCIKRDEILLIPDVVMREGGEVFLDDVSRQDVEEVLGVKTIVIESTPKGLVDAVTKEGL